MSSRKKIIQFVLFFAIMLLTFYVVFRDQDLPAVLAAAAGMPLPFIVAAMLLGLFFASAEGIMIWYLLRSMGRACSFCRCILYSFVGFFYSGITPSATGGQPMQLYYMNKDGCKASDATVILMTMALAYKLVLVIIGLWILLVWYRPLKDFMGEYMLLYFAGIVLNLIVVLAIIWVMLFPGVLVRTAVLLERSLIRLHIWKENPGRQKKIQDFAESYGRAVSFLAGHRDRLAAVLVITLLQRCSMFCLTYVIYRGFGLVGGGAYRIMALQAAVYIAVDMLPIPGAQGITELVYRKVFQEIFTGGCLLPSMLVSRGMNFYVPLIICGIAAGAAALRDPGRKEDCI